MSTLVSPAGTSTKLSVNQRNQSSQDVIDEKILIMKVETGIFYALEHKLKGHWRQTGEVIDPVSEGLMRQTELNRVGR